MPGPKFSITDDAVTKHSSNLDTSEQDLNARASSFISAVAPLEGVWQGTSYGSWSELTTAWNSAMKDLNAALSSIKGGVGNAGQLYQQYEEEQTSNLAKVAATAGEFKMP